MAERTIRTAGPDHPISIEHQAGRVVVLAAGRTVADSRDALVLREAAYPAVLYVPREHADMTLLQRTGHQTYCPYKGECSYFSIVPAGEAGVNAVWSYEAPFPAMSQIKGHLAFYPERVGSISTRPD